MKQRTQPTTVVEPTTRVHDGAAVSTGTSFLSASPRRYTLGDRLGAGGFGSVYLADMQTGLGHRQVVAKVLRASAELSTERILDEGRAGIRLDHPGIAHVYDILPVEDGTMALVTSYIQGADLGQLRDLEQGVVHLPRSAVADVAAEVGFALAHAHERGVVHRDIKPANIVVSRAGVAILIDFGIATFEEKFARTATGMVAGTPWYFTPEHLGDGAGPPADVAALAMVIYELWTGRRFLVSDPRAIMGLVSDESHYERHLDERLRQIDNRRVAAILRQALAFDAAERPSAKGFGRVFAGMRLRGPSLRMWAVDHAWARPSTRPGDLTGRVLEVGTLPAHALERDDGGERVEARRWMGSRWLGPALLGGALVLGGGTGGLVAGLLLQPGGSPASPMVPVGQGGAGDGGEPAAASVGGVVVSAAEGAGAEAPADGSLEPAREPISSLASGPTDEPPPGPAASGGSAVRAPVAAPVRRVPTSGAHAKPGRFLAVGGVTSVELRSGRQVFTAGQALEPGSYTVFVDFGEGFEPAHPSATSAGAGSSLQLEVLPGQTVSVRCRRALRRCDVVQP